MKIIIIARANPGYMSKTLANTTAIAPNTILEILEPLFNPADNIPDPIKPSP